MTLKIERQFDGAKKTVRLTGQAGPEHIAELQIQIAGAHRETVLDLEQVTLVDLSFIHFLRECEAAGIEVRNCPRYVREWMRQEES